MKKNGGKGKDGLKRIKTGRWERQWSITKAGITAGTQASARMLGTAFLPPSLRDKQQKKILSEQSLYLANELGKLKGSVVKVGQIMALYGEHVLPEEVTDAFRTLEEQTHALSWSAIEPLLKQELGSLYNEFTIEKEPLGAASLAQVHRAVHKPDGEEVCLKVQYPGVAESIDSDLGSIVSLLKLTRMVSVNRQFEEWLGEVRKLMAFEVDYVREAEMTNRFAALLAKDDRFIVPRIYSRFTTPRLLVSSYESGVAVSDASVLQIPQPERNRLGRAFLELFIAELFEWGDMQTDPNFGNYRIQQQADGSHAIVLLDFGAVLHYDEEFLSPVKSMVLGACHNDYPRIRQAAIDFGMMKEEYPEDVHRDFSGLCQLLVEPFTYRHHEVPPTAVNGQGEYCFARSDLPVRAAKYAAKSALSKYFAIPPKEFAFLSRKLLGVYSFISALQSEFDPQDLLDKY